MKKTFIICVICLTSVILNADIYSYKYVVSFIKEGGEKTEQLTALLVKDKNFIEANELLTNKKRMKKIKTNTADPETKEPIKMEDMLIPDYAKALSFLMKSALTKNNPVSAYEALYIINTKFTKKQYLTQFRDLSKVLYENEKNMCLSYLYYGETLAKGYGVKVNRKMAHEIYKDAEKVASCKQGWYKHVVPSKIAQTK